MRVTFLALFLALSFLSAAQDALTLGNRILGGGILFSQRDFENEYPANTTNGLVDEERIDKRFRYSFAPYYGRMYEDFRMVGINLSIEGSTFESTFAGDQFESRYEDTSFSFGIGGFLRQYFPYSDKFGAFLQSGINLSRSRLTRKNGSFTIPNDIEPSIFSTELERKAWGGSIYSEVGIYFFVLEQLSIETRLARFFFLYEDQQLEERRVLDGTVRDGDGSDTRLDFNLINNFSFDQIFTINYYF